MRKIYFEDRAGDQAFRLNTKKEFRIKNKRIHLEITTHYGNYSLFGIEEYYTILDQWDNKEKTINPSYGKYVLQTDSYMELINFIRDNYNKEPIFPEDFNKKIEIVKEDMQKDETKALSWKFPEIRKALGWD